MVMKGYAFKQSKSLMRISLASILMISILMMFIKAIGLFIDLDTRLYASIASFSGVLIGGGFYGWAILRLNVFSRDELQYIPIVKKLVK
jgi:PST family polysaccharide transporter